MRKFTLHAAIIGALLVAFGAGSYALAGGGKSEIKADDMTGYLEAPPISSAAAGNFDARIDDEADEIHYTLSYSGLEGDVRQAHIHFGQRSVSGGISAWLCETATNPSPSASTPACPTPGGTVTGVITPAEVVCTGCSAASPNGQGIAAGEFEELVAAIRAGRAYANVHSSKFPGGELRGQLNDQDQRDD
jgi:CHRD domain